MSDRPKFSRAVALEVAAELCRVLAPICYPERLIVAGSLRRRAALRKGWKWNPYGAGFTDRAVFELVGLPYREPWERT